MEKLMNLDNNQGDCVEHAQVKIPFSNIALKEVEAAMNFMRSGRANGPTSSEYIYNRVVYI